MSAPTLQEMKDKAAIESRPIYRLQISMMHYALESKTRWTDDERERIGELLAKCRQLYAHSFTLENPAIKFEDLSQEDQKIIAPMALKMVKRARLIRYGIYCIALLAFVFVCLSFAAPALTP